MQTKITAKVLSGAKPNGRDFNISDTVLPGFHVRVSRAGTMSYRYRYQRVDGSQAVITIGNVAELSPDAARDIARDHAETRRRGIDPAAQRQAQRAELVRRKAHTFADLAARWMEAKARDVRLGNIRKVTLDEYRQLLDGHVLPRLGALPFADMTRGDVRQAVEDIMASIALKRADATGGRRASAALTVIKMVFNWAMAEELADKNPAHTVKPPAKPKTRERALTDAEWRALFAALTIEEERQRIGVTEPIAIAIQLCAFTLLRRASVAGLRRAEVSLTDRTWTVPASRMKTGQAFVVPLSEPALALIERAFALAGASDFAFPQRNGASAIEPAVITRAMGRAMHALGLPTAGPHDLRRTGRTLLTSERIGVSFETAERCISHEVGGVVSRSYDLNAYLGPKRQAFAALGDELVRIAADVQRPSNVISLVKPG